jgi:hypothetical protein
MLGGPPATAVASGPFQRDFIFANRFDYAGMHEIGATALEFRARRRSLPTGYLTPAALMICLTAEETSGPIPSPGIRVMVCFIVAIF